MDQKLLDLESGKQEEGDHSQGLRREVDSIDDFEHLGHDSSPLKESGDLMTTAAAAVKTATTAIPAARDDKLETHNQINTTTTPPPSQKGVDLAKPIGLSDKLSSLTVTSDNNTLLSKIMDSNLLENLGMSDNFQNCKESDDKLDKFLQDMSSFAPTQQQQFNNNKHNEPPEITNKQKTEDFLKEETKTTGEKLEFLTDSDHSDDDDDDFKPSKYQDFPKQVELPESSTIINKNETFKDVEEKIETITKQPELVEKIASPPGATAPTVKEIKPTAPPSSPPPPPPQQQQQPAKAAVVETSPPKNKPEAILCKKPTITETEKQVKKSTVIDAEAIFCKMGLVLQLDEMAEEQVKHAANALIDDVINGVANEMKKGGGSVKNTDIDKSKQRSLLCVLFTPNTWFHPERLNPKVESLIYWRDPKKSGPIFGGVLLVLLALTYFSLISVIAYLSLLALTGTISFRIYKNVVQAVQKTGDGHPFKEYLEYDVALPQDKVKEISEVAVAHINAAVIELRRLFLVEDLVDSVKFGVLLWTLTYLGAWFNGMTLIIIAWVALFTLPKVYETNKTQIDANLEIVRTKLAEITSKVKAAIPIGKKPAVEEKKEQ